MHHTRTEDMASALVTLDAAPLFIKRTLRCARFWRFHPCSFIFHAPHMLTFETWYMLKC